MANNPAAFNAIIAQIQANTISRVDLSGAGLTSDDMTNLVAALKNNTSVDILHLNANNIKVNGLPQVIDLIQSNTPLGMITLDTASLDNSDAVAVAAALKNNKNLYAIVMNYNSITANGALALVDSIAVHPKITHVQLMGNAISDEAARRLANIPRITILLLSSCSLTPQGTRWVFEGLRDHRSFTDLRLDANHFTVDCLQPLADALLSGSPLQVLSLRNIGLGNALLYSLSGSIEHSQLAYLYLDGNGIGDTAAAAFIPALQKITSLREVVITNNAFYDDNVFQVNAAIARNQQRPQLTAYTIRVAQGGVTTITSNHFQGSSPRAGSLLQYSVRNVQNGVFLVDNRSATQFTKTQLDNNQVKFLHGGSKFSPSFQIQLSDGTYTTQWQQSVIRFIPYVGDIVLQKGEFNITRGGVTTLTRNNLLATLGNSTNAAPDLVFNFTTTGCYMQLVPSPLLAQYGLPLEPQRVTSCPQSLVLSGALQVVHNGSDVVPQVLVSVSDGGTPTSAVPMSIVYNSASSTIRPTSAPAPTGATTSLMSSTTTSAATSASTGTTVAPASTTRAVSTVTTLPLTSTGSSTTIAPTSTTGAVSTTPATAVVSASSATDSTARALGAAGLAIGLATMVGLIITGWWLRKTRQDIYYDIEQRQDDTFRELGATHNLTRDELLQQRRELRTLQQQIRPRTPLAQGADEGEQHYEVVGDRDELPLAPGFVQTAQGVQYNPQGLRQRLIDARRQRNPGDLFIPNPTYEATNV